MINSITIFSYSPLVLKIQLYSFDVPPFRGYNTLAKKVLVTFVLLLI